MNKITAYGLYSYFGARGLLNWIPDSRYLEIQYWLKLHRKLNLNCPQTMNEKLQWLKLHDRKPIYTELVDKYKVREHIRRVVGEELLIPLVGIWENPDKIDFTKLPQKFVIKCNHDSGGVVICRDKSNLDINKAKNILNKKFHRTYYWGNREWPYKEVQPLVFAEEFLEECFAEGGLTDYKFYCFNGKPECVVVCVDRKPGYANFIFFDKEWNRLDYNIQTDEEKRRVVQKPKNFGKMLMISEQIASYVNSPFLRVDLYNIGGKIYFGEITFYPHSGMDGSLKPEIDIMFGNRIKLEAM